MALISKPAAHHTVLPLAMAVLVGGTLGLTVGALSDMPLKRIVFALFALVLPFLAVMSREPKRVLTFLFFLLIPVNIEYFLFSQYAEHMGGAGGLYLLPLDLPLAALYCIWLYERATPGSKKKGRGSLVIVLLPFLAALLLSTLHSVNVKWSLFEILRWLRFFLILLYFAANFKKEDTGLILVAICTTVFLQASLSTMQMVFKSSLGLASLGFTGRGTEAAFVQQLSESSEAVRGAGTAGHPNILGTFLLLTLPAIGAVALAEHRRRYRLWCGAIFLLGATGLATTLSRGAVASFAGACLLILVLFFLRRWISFPKTVTVSFAALTIVALTAFTFQDALQGRFQFDLKESFDFRAELNAIALDIFQDNPFLGVGTNNFTLVLDRYAPKMSAHMDAEEGARAAVHNLYLLLLSETGACGLLAFLVFTGTVLGKGARGLMGPPSLEGYMTTGLAVGILAAMVHNTLEFTLITNTNLYALATLSSFLDLMGGQRT